MAVGFHIVSHFLVNARSVFWGDARARERLDTEVGTCVRFYIQSGCGMWHAEDDAEEHSQD